MWDNPFLAIGGPAGEAFAAAAGVTAALLLLGGPMLLRFQRQRQQFLLAKGGLERGLTPVSNDPPVWLQSMRTGVMTLTLGVSLFVAGAIACAMVARMHLPLPTDV